ncbi:MAG: N-acetylmuramoyl-L-alanine amidase family protein [Bacillota bacterium]
MNIKKFFLLLPFAILPIFIISYITVSYMLTGTVTGMYKHTEKVDKTMKQVSGVKQGKEAQPKDSASTIDEKQASEVYIICIDPGHQAKHNNDKEPVAPNSKEFKAKVSPGSKGIVTKTPEYQLNLEVSLLLKKELEKRGYAVVMTRETNKVNISNIERAELANSSNADVFLRIHADGDKLSETSGISVLCPAEDSSYTREIYKKSELLASCILDELILATEGSSRGVDYRSDLTGFNWSKVPVALIEMGFLTNPEEDRKLNTEEYRLKIVHGIAEGLERYFDKI